MGFCKTKIQLDCISQFEFEGPSSRHLRGFGSPSLLRARPRQCPGASARGDGKQTATLSPHFIAFGSDDRESKWRWRCAPSRPDRIVVLLARLPTRARGNTCAHPRATTARGERLRALILFSFRVRRPRISTARRVVALRSFLTSSLARSCPRSTWGGRRCS